MAQTEACHGTRLATFWLHGCFLQLDSAKMAKSAGGFVRLQTIIDRGYDPLAYRFFCLSAHYRAKLNLTWESLDGAATALDRLRAAVHAWGPPGEPDKDSIERFTAQINDDLNMPRALAVTWDLVRSELSAPVRKATVLEFDRVLGLRLAQWRPRDDEVPDAIMALVRRREEARGAKRWQEADALRAEITAAGYQIDDKPDGTRVRRRRPGPEE
jgi:cysteinyl-tRNA synthetase